MAGRPWFRIKRYGLGFTPVSWQGWIVATAYGAGVIILGVTLAERQPYIFGTLIGLATVAFVVVALRTGRT